MEYDICCLRISYRCCNLNWQSFCSAVQVFGWRSAGTITFYNVACLENAAGFDGGCFYGMGNNILNDGVVMLDNGAEDGGCICK